MSGNIIVDAGFLVALLSRRDSHHRWAVEQGERFPPPWKTCQAALSEAFYLLGTRGGPTLRALLRREAVVVDFNLGDHLDPVLKFMEKYAGVPASLADASLVRMSETLAAPMILTTDIDFHIYRRHSRHVVPCMTPA
ncbi:MAG: PIN domain-containing protein [Acidobacteria bacterium]|nr:PIN domain-containing protein [Acidobacteriota bacterium]